VPEAFNINVCGPVLSKCPLPEKVTPLIGAVAIFQDPVSETVTVIACDTPNTGVSTFIAPVTPPLQFGEPPKTAVPPEDRLDTVRLKLQLGDVLIV
jgi:hypothetical protein